MKNTNNEMHKALSQEPILIKNGKQYFRQVDKENEITDSLDQLKLTFKKFPRIYYFLIHVTSPVCSDWRPLNRFLSSVNGLVVNIGSGNSPRQDKVVNVDMIDYENVDIVCDIHDLPFKDNSIDAVMSLAVLEHVREPAVVLKEVHRVLKPGGRVFSVIPFMQPFHASPHDYQRYTLLGIEFLHKDFQKVESGVFSGPVSGALWAVQEALASVFSFGSEKLKNLLTIGIMLLTWPVKFLDLIVMPFPTAKNVASNFYFHGKK